MLVTEEEAKTKRCQEGFGPPVSGMQMTMAMPMCTAHVMAPSHCLGSGCMAWRWAGWLDSNDRLMTLIPAQPDDPRVGYCGKAGEP